MKKYILKRAVISLLTIWVLVTVVFFMARMMPGGPFNNPKLTPEARANLAAYYGFDKPLPVSYTHLDVYKRQIYYSSLSEADRASFDAAERNIINAAYNTYQLVQNQAVSYTHLDVYKRQGVSSRQMYGLRALCPGMSEAL